MPVQIPKDTERTCGMVSVTTRKPPGRTVRRMSPAPFCPAISVRVVPGSWSPACAKAFILGRLLRGDVCDGLGRGLRVGGGLVGDHGDQRELAPLVDLGD